MAAHRCGGCRGCGSRAAGAEPLPPESRRRRAPAGLVVRAATALDRAVAVQLLTAHLRERWSMTPPAGIRRAVDGAVRDPAQAFVLLALLRGVPVGVAYGSLAWSLEGGGRSAWLQALYVAPEHRSRGVGRALLTAACAAARARRATCVDLEVEASQARSLRLFAREGFRPLDRQRLVRSLKR